MSSTRPTIVIARPRPRRRRRGWRLLVLAAVGPLALWAWRWPLCEPFIKAIIADQLGELLQAEVYIESCAGSLFTSFELYGLRADPLPGSHLRAPARLDQLRLRYQPWLPLVGLSGLDAVHLRGIRFDSAAWPSSTATSPSDPPPPLVSLLAALPADGRLPRISLQDCQLRYDGLEIDDLRLTAQRQKDHWRARLTSSRISHPAIPEPPTNLVCTLQIDARTMQLGSESEPGLDLSIGHGRVALWGHVDRRNRPETLALHLRLRDVLALGGDADRIRRIRVDGDLQLAGSPAQPLLSGSIALPLVQWHEELVAGGGGDEEAPASTTEALDQIGVDLPMAPAGGLPLPGLAAWQGLELDVALATSRPALVANTRLATLVRFTGHLGGDLSAPRLSGRIKASQGEVRLVAGTFLPVNNLSLTLPDQAGAEPIIDFQSTLTSGLVKIDLRLTGNLAHPSLQITSDPPYAQDELLGLLIFGRPPGQIDDEGQGNFLAGQALRVASAIAFDRLPRIQERSHEDRSAFLFELGGRDGRGVSQELPFELESGARPDLVARAEYVFNQHWSLISLLDADNNPAADLQYRIRFGLPDDPSDQPQPPRNTTPPPVQFSGNHALSSSDLTRVLALPPLLGPAQEWDAVRLSDATFRIERAYRDRGYLDIAIDSAVVDDHTRPIACFVIREGRQYQLGLVHFTWVDSQGNACIPPADPLHPERRLDADRLRSALFSTDLVGGPAFNERLVEAQGASVRAFLHARGLRAATVTTRQQPGAEAHLVDVHLRLQAGPVSRLIGLRWEPELVVPELPRPAVVATAEYLGQPLGSGLPERIALAVHSHLRSAGHLGARCTARVEWHPDHPELGTVVLAVEPGPRYTVGPILIEGEQRVHEGFIRKLLDFPAHETLGSDQLRTVQKRLIDTGLFERVLIASEPLPDADRSADTVEAAVSISLAERDPYEWRMRIGYGTVDQIRLGTDFIVLSPLGGPERIRVGADANLSTQTIDSEFTRPWLFMQPSLTGSLRAFWTHSEQSEPRYNEYLYGLSSTLGWRISRHSRLRLGLLAARIEDRERDRQDTVFPPFIELAYDGRDDRFHPRSGFRFRTRIEAADQNFLGSTLDYAKTTLTFSTYLPLPKRLSLAFGIDTGHIDTWADTDSTELPRSYRFTAGGAFSVRGFDNNELGPRDENGASIGGDVLLVLRSELRVPLSGDLHGVLFSDWGNAFVDADAVHRDELRHGAGVGLRYHTPAGSLITDVGWNLDRREGEDAWAFHLAFGMPF